MDTDVSAHDLTTLSRFVHDECERRLRAYEAQPRDAAEHFETENEVLSGGYAHRQLYELVQNAADAILEAQEESGRIIVRLSPDRLEVANTGTALDEPGIVALLNVRFFYQIRNMMEFVEMVIRRKSPEDQVSVHLVTGPDDGNVAKQRDLLDSIADACVGSGVEFTWTFDGTGTAHARDIVTDTGWKIVLDRGLDIFQAPIKKDGFSLGDHLQEHRIIKGFYVTYVRNDRGQNACFINNAFNSSTRLISQVRPT